MNFGPFVCLKLQVDLYSNTASISNLYQTRSLDPIGAAGGEALLLVLPHHRDGLAPGLQSKLNTVKLCVHILVLKLRRLVLGYLCPRSRRHHDTNIDADSYHQSSSPNVLLAKSNPRCLEVYGRCSSGCCGGCYEIQNAQELSEWRRRPLQCWEASVAHGAHSTSCRPARYEGPKGCNAHPLGKLYLSVAAWQDFESSGIRQELGRDCKLRLYV